LSAVGGITSRPELGLLVSPPGFRNPALFAKMVATLDHITGGRVIVGLGAGWFAQEFEGYGFPFPPARERLEQLRETITIMKRMWTEETPTFTGKHFRVESVICQPRPSRRPPVLIGGGGEKVLLAIAAEHADIWNNLAVHQGALARKIEVLRRHCREVGRDFDAITISQQTLVVIGEDEKDGREKMEKATHLYGRHFGDIDNAGIWGAGSGCRGGSAPHASRRSPLRDRVLRPRHARPRSSSPRTVMPASTEDRVENPLETPRLECADAGSAFGLATIGGDMGQGGDHPRDRGLIRLCPLLPFSHCTRGSVSCDRRRSLRFGRSIRRAGVCGIPGVWLLVSVAGALSADPGLVQERLRPGPGAQRVVARRRDRRALTASHFVIRGSRCGPLPLVRFGSVALRWAGLVVVIASLAIGAVGNHRESFLLVGGSRQSGRGHRVISSGPYATCGIPGTPGPSGSRCAAGCARIVALDLAQSMAIGLLVRRISREERVLREGLPGYESYQQRVRYRLVPGLW
jgi:alkanesulfonate monooxygenase SsuD/methylene tetrahydromethanopterin reductase-like flavin-dependent oxidoreductase (luciferase family)